jgi:hypothetical protein
MYKKEDGLSDAFLRNILLGEKMPTQKEGSDVKANEEILAQTINIAPNEPYTEAYQRDGDSLKSGQVPDNFLYELYLDSQDSYLGCYCTNNGMVVIIEGNGNIHAGPHTESLTKSLKNAGFRYRDGITVPFCNDDRPANPELWQRLQELREIARNNR